MSVGNNNILGGFRVVRELKSGAQGTVYQAVCESDDMSLCPRGSVVALKAMTIQEDANERYASLERRTQELIELRHRHIVRYLGCFRQAALFSELHVVVQEFLEGETLKERLEHNPGGLDTDGAVRVSVAMVTALAEAEAHGICHRDIKPGNIFLCRNGDIKLIDFEVARTSVDASTSTSSSGRMIGSFDYMAPDFVDSTFRGDFCSDVFSAGVVVHEAIAGRTPYRQQVGAGGSADFEFMSRWAKNPDGTFQTSPIAISPKINRLLAHMDILLKKALAPYRNNRIKSFSTFAQELRKIRFRDLVNENRTYRVLQLVGKGGFGEVFKARDKQTGELVAVKRLLKAEYASRFHREARIMKQLNDPCFVKFVDFFVVNNSGSEESFLLMDFLEGMPGSSLKDAIKSVSGVGLPRKNVLRAFARYAHGLAILHARGIYHRDIKPANLYYPVDKPENSAIMDFGIARDVNGTATTGGMPGTFDYMPPEVVMMQTRGESGMDIYALGLCFYEALTGKMAYPKLPHRTAAEAYAQFFLRAKSLARPNLDGLKKSEDAEILELVRKMTEPDINARLLDTAALEHRLWELAGETNPYAIKGDQTDVTTVSDVIGIDTITRDSTLLEGNTVKVAPPQTKARVKRNKFIGDAHSITQGLNTKRKHIVKRVVIGGILLAVVAGGYFQRAHIQELVTLTRTKIEQQKIAKAKLRAEDLRQQQIKKLSQARRLVNDIVVKYGDENCSLEEVDADYGLWRKKWEGELDTQDLERIETERMGYRNRRQAQEEERAKLWEEDTRRHREAEAVVMVYAKEGLEKGDQQRDRWLKVWSSSPEVKKKEVLAFIDQARNKRQRDDLENVAYAEAQRAIEGVIASYRDESIDIADRKRLLWESEWRDSLGKEHLAALTARLDGERANSKDRYDENNRHEQELRLERECKILCDMLEPVETRHSRLNEADDLLTEGISTGVIKEPRLTQLRAMIHARRDWTVFRLINHLESIIAIGDEAIAKGQSHLFVYTNGVPSNLCAECKGFEPYSLGRAHDGRTIRLSKEMLTAKPVAVSLPELEEGVVCRIDGALVATSTVNLMPGSHVCTYSRPQSRDQVVVFSVGYGTPISLSGPEVWQVSEEVINKNREAVRLHKAQEITRTCRELMQIEPLSTRRSRLTKCDAKLREWNVDSILGSTQAAQLREELARESARVVGIVSNQTSYVVYVGGTAQTIQIPAKSSLRLVFDNGVPEHASLQVKGYDPVELPANFDGRTFVFRKDMLVDSPVRITVQELPEGVTCLIDGRPAVGICELRPGLHTYTYRKGDCADIRQEFMVTNATPATLPLPTGWKASSALSSLESAWTALNDGAFDKVERFLEAAEVQSEENMQRKREIERRVVLRKQYVALKDKANGYFVDGLWNDALRVLADLKNAGYVFTEEENARCRTIYDNGRERCKVLREAALSAKKMADAEKADSELRKLHQWYAIIEGKPNK